MNQEEKEKIDFIDQVNQKAWEIRSISNQAFEMSERVLALSNDINYIRGRGEALRTLAFCYIRISKPQEATPLLDEASEIFQSLGDAHGLTAIHACRGIINRNYGEYAPSLENLFKAAEYGKSVDYHEGVALVYYHIRLWT